MRKLITAASLLTMLASTSAHAQQQSEAAQQSKLAPVVHRKIPKGWFGGGTRLTATAQSSDSNVQRAIAQAIEGTPATLASHFDTAGSFSRYSSRRSGAAERLKAVRNAKVFPNLPTAKPQTLRTVRSEQVAPPAYKETATPEASVSEPNAAQQSPSANTAVTTKSKTDTAKQDVTVDLDSLSTMMKSADRAVDRVAEKPKSVVRPKPVETLRPLPEEKMEGFVEAKDEPLTIDTPIDLPAPSVKEHVTESIPPEKSWEVVDQESELIEPDDTTPLKITAAPADETPTKIDVSTQVASEGVPPSTKQLSPVLFAEAKGPQTIIVGREASYEVFLQSQNSQSANEVSVLVNVPGWVEVVENHSSIGNARIIPDDNGHALVQWKIDRLPGNTTEKLTLKLIPRESRTIDLAVNWIFKPSTSITHIQVQEPKLEMSVTGPHEVLFGDTQLYTVSVSNPGTGDAENVLLHLLPVVPTENTAGTKRIGVLKAGERQTIKVELTARQAGELQVRARATADGDLKASDVQDVIVRRANLVIEVDGPPQKYAGTVADYTVRISNNGDANAREVTATSNLPGGSAYVSCSDGGTFNEGQKQVSWQIGALRPGDTRVFQFKCKLDSPGANRIDVRALAAGDLSALQTCMTEVESLADLKLTVNDPAGAIPVGTNTEYELHIVNRGTKAAKNIHVVGYFSEGIEPVNIGNWKGDVEEGQVALEKIPRIGPGQEMTIRVVAKAHRPGDHVFRAELECRDPHTRLAHEEWTSFYGDPLPVRQASSQPTYGPQAEAPQRLDIRR